MAEKVKTDQKNKKANLETKKKSGSMFKIVLIVFILLILAATGFGVGIYLKFIDVQQLADNWKLSQYPVIGSYFSPPKTNFETVELNDENPISASPNPGVPPVASPESPLVEKKKIDDVELQKQAKLKQQEEAKRISKLARLYGGMKPDEAVAILNKMDNDTVLVILNKMEDEQVSKIMALFDAGRAATLSQNMLRGGRSTN